MPALGGRIRFYTRKDWQYYQEPYTGLTIPCGYCILCRQEQARQQAVRIAHEAQLHPENAFITLTYDDAHIPPYGGLRYEDLQKFWKRLRKHLSKTNRNIRYYAVGEYGDDKLRPHYHAVVFGLSFTEDAITIRETPTRLWTSPMLERCWGLGQVSVGNVTFDTANYCASYVTKKLAQKQKYVRVDQDSGELIALQQPRAFMSKNLAREWWRQWGAYAAAHDFIVIDGKKMKPPKAYDKWLGAQDPERLAQIKEQRMKSAKQLTPQEARARARSAHARAKSKRKKL